jgi:hypothetical protein
VLPCDALALQAHTAVAVPTLAGTHAIQSLTLRRENTPAKRPFEINDHEVPRSKEPSQPGCGANANSIS